MFDEKLSSHNTMRVGGTVSAWYMPGSPEELVQVTDYLRDAGERTVVSGNGSNVLMPDGNLEAVVISLSGDWFTRKVFEGDIVSVGAGEKLSSLISECCARGLSGMEGLVGIPGTVGGALLMNAAYRSAISAPLLRVRVLDGKGRIRWLERDELVFGYRRSSFEKDDILIEAVFRLKEVPLADIRERLREYFLEKLNSQPMDEKTLGCVFKNPRGSSLKSAQMIDMAGLKGLRCGGAVVSLKHANFIVNTGNATARDVKLLISEIQDKVRATFSVELEPEIEIID